MAIPVSVIVVTKNEAGRIGRCLAALKDFELAQTAFQPFAPTAKGLVDRLR